MIKLSVGNFFGKFILHPKSSQLNSKDKKIALGCSITIGVLSLSLSHIVAKIVSLFRKKHHTTASTSDTSTGTGHKIHKTGTDLKSAKSDLLFQTIISSESSEIPSVKKTKDLKPAVPPYISSENSLHLKTDDAKLSSQENTKDLKPGGIPNIGELSENSQPSETDDSKLSFPQNREDLQAAEAGISNESPENSQSIDNQTNVSNNLENTADLQALSDPQITKTIFEAKMEKMIIKCLTEYQGFILGENHVTRYSKKFLIDNLELFKMFGVKYLFLEGLNEDEAGNELDAFYASKAKMPVRLKDKLIACDALNITKNEFCLTREEALEFASKDYEINQKYNKYQLVLQARKFGIKIVPIDKNSLRAVNLKPQGKRRLPEMNKFADYKIKSILKPTDRYIVFCGAAHSLKVKTSEPGLGNRLGVPVIHLAKHARPESVVKKNHTYKGQFMYTPDYYIEYGVKETLD